MGFIKKISKKVGKGIEKISTSPAEKAANAYAEESRQERAKLEEKTKKERARAQKLAIRGIRSRRSVQRFAANTGENPSYGSTTIG